jgi:hypothetical protein
MNCKHSQVTTDVPQTKRIAGCDFHFVASVCNECGAVLWTKDIERQYSAWAKLNRDKFTVQFSLPSEVAKKMADIVSAFPNVTESDFVRAALSVYLGFVFSNQSLSESIENVVSSEAFKSEFLQGTRRKLKVRMNAALWEAVESWAAILETTGGRLVEDAVVAIVAALNNHDKENLWNLDVDRQMNLILKAA